MNHLLLLLLLPLQLSSQVIFCENVDSFGKPERESNEFKIGPEGGYFKVLVKLNDKVNSNSVVIDLFKFSDDKEVFENSIRMDVNPAITWFYKEITFKTAGIYHVYVYDEKDKLLGVGKVTIRL